MTGTNMVNYENESVSELKFLFFFWFWFGSHSLKKFT